MFKKLTNKNLPKGRTVIATNNIKARDAHGDLSHIWIGTLYKEEDTSLGKFYLTDSNFNKVFGITHFIETTSLTEKKH